MLRGKCRHDADYIFCHCSPGLNCDTCRYRHCQRSYQLQTFSSKPFNQFATQGHGQELQSSTGNSKASNQNCHPSHGRAFCETQQPWCWVFEAQTTAAGATSQGRRHEHDQISKVKRGARFSTPTRSHSATVRRAGRILLQSFVTFISSDLSLSSNQSEITLLQLFMPHLRSQSNFFKRMCSFPYAATLLSSVRIE